MALAFNRSSARTDERPAGATSLWLAAGLGMASLAASIILLRPEEALAIAAGLLVLILAMADLRNGVLAFVVLYPFMPDSWGVDVAEWMPYLSARRLCCLALTLVFLFQCKDAWDTPRVKTVGRFLAVLIIAQLLVGFVSNDPLSAIKRTFGDVVEYYAPFMIAAHLFRTKEQVHRLFTIVAAAMAVVAIMAIIEHSIDYNFYDSFVTTRADINYLLTEKTQMTRGIDVSERRVRVAFDHSILLGLHIMCTLFASVYLLRQRRLFQRIFLLAGLPVFCLAMLFTYSRGPMVGLVTGLIWLGLIGRGTRSLLVVMLACGVAAYFLMPAKGREVLGDTIATSTDIETGVTSGGGTVRARLDLLTDGLQLASGSLLFGHGIGDVRQTKMKARKTATVDFSTVDNYYLAVLLDDGVLVLLLTVAFFVYLLGVFTRAALRVTDRDGALLNAMAAALCVATFVALGTMGGTVSLFWILLGPALRAADLYQPEERRGRPLRRHEDEDMNANMQKGSQRREMAPAGSGPRPARRLSFPAGQSHSSRTLKLFSSGRIVSGAAVLLALLGAGLSGAAPCQAAPSFYGTTGLFAAPVAAVAPRGAWSLGSNYVGRDFRPGASSVSKGTINNSFTLTLLPRLELAIVLTNYEARLGSRVLNHGLTPDRPLGGLTFDRMAAAHWLVLTQRGYRPAIAIGWRDLFGIQPLFAAKYGVMSLRRGRLMLSAGAGTGLLHGPFGGAEFDLTPRVAAIVEGLSGQANGGFRLMPLKDVQLDASFMGFRSLGGGLSYRRRF